MSLAVLGSVKVVTVGQLSLSFSESASAALE